MATGYEDLLPKRPAATTGYEDLLPKRSATTVVARQPVATPTPVAEPTIDYGEAATMMTAPSPELEKPKIAFKDLVTNPELFKRAENYMKAVGQPAYKPGEDKEEYVKKFMSERRFNDVNLLFGTTTELKRLVNAPDETKKSIAEGIDLYENVAGAFTEQGQGGVRPVVDVLKAVGADIPTYAVSAGVGRLGAGATLTAIRSAMGKEVSKQALSKAGAAGIVGAEVATGGVGDVYSQRVEQEVSKAFGEEPAPLNPVRTGAVALFSGAVSAAPLAAKAFRPTTVKQQGQALAEAIAEAEAKQQPIVPTNPNAPQTKVEKALTEPLRDNMDAVHTQYMKTYGRQLLDTIDPQNELTNAKVRNEHSKAAVRIAMKVIELDPAFQLKPNEQVSAAINKVFARLDKIDNATLEAALTSEGVTKQQFAAMMQASVSDAASQMQQYSVAARMLKKMVDADPDFAKKIKNIYSIQNDQVSGLAKAGLLAYRAQQRVAREWKAFLTSGVDTTARNTFSLAVVLPLKSGVQFLEGSLYSVGTALSKGASGRRAEVFTRAMSDTVHDAFDVYFYMRKKERSTEVTDAILKSNPSIRDSIVTGLQETGDNEVSALARWANSLNVAIDSFSRRAIFVASVERQLRRQNKSLMLDFLKTGTDIPTPILKEAAKEAQQMTFSYLPRLWDNTTASAFEKAGATAGSVFISAVDKIPFAGFAIPFPRYMVNAMAYTYRYSPVGFVGAFEETAQAIVAANKGNTGQAEKLLRQSSEKWIQGSIGLAALLAAIDYRKENPDVPWYEMKTDQGTTVDMRPLGFFSGYLAIADVVARRAQNAISGEEVKAAIESITGLKTKAGSGDAFYDRLIGMFQSEDMFREFMIEMGKTVGDIAGGFSQPFVVKQLFDLYNSVREKGSVIRDPNIIEAETAGGAFVEAAQERLMGKFPVFKEKLPEAVIRLSEGERTREGEYFSRLLGFREVIQRNPVEQEIVRLNLDPFDLYGTSSGDRVYDRDFIKNANEIVLQRVGDLIKDPQYSSLPDIEKRIMMKDVVGDATSIAKTLTNEKYKNEDLLKIYKMTYNKLPKDYKRAIDERYSQDNDGRTIEEDRAYFQIDKYLAELKARTGVSKESQQTRRMLGR